MDKKGILSCFTETRIALGMTQQDLEKKSGIARANIARFEKGDGNPTLKTMLALASAMDKKLEITLK